jgi:GTP cyclohydrolase I
MILGMNTGIRVRNSDPTIFEDIYPIDDIGIVDDLIDSGETLTPYVERGFKCFPIFGKEHSPQLKNVHEPIGGRFDCWLHFPWERADSEGVAGPHDAITRILEYIGENPAREGLKETPDRVVRSYGELFAGYGREPEEVLKIFDSESYDQIVLSKDIQVFSMCEHHMLPFVGRAHVAYIPNGKVIGLSKLSRLVDLFARRLQIQERLTDQVAQTLMDILKPQAAACIIEAQHFCMCMRGVNKQDSSMVTSSVKGKFFEDPRARAELLELIK